MRPASAQLAARMKQYSVSRKKSPMSDSARWERYVTDCVNSGWTTQSSAMQNATGVAPRSPNRRATAGSSSVRRTMPKSASAASR